MRIESGSIEADRDGMNALAEDTGGKAIFNNNDLNLGLQRVLDDTESYYLLAFEPMAFTSLKASAYSALSSAGGGPGT